MPLSSTNTRAMPARPTGCASLWLALRDWVRTQSLLGSRSRWQDMHGKDIDQARVLVEMERERTMAGWVPRRLGTRCQRRRPAPLVCLTHRPTCVRQAAGLGARRSQGRYASAGETDRGASPSVSISTTARLPWPFQPSTQGLD